GPPARAPHAPPRSGSTRRDADPGGARLGAVPPSPRRGHRHTSARTAALDIRLPEQGFPPPDRAVPPPDGARPLEMLRPPATPHFQDLQQLVGAVRAVSADFASTTPTYSALPPHLTEKHAEVGSSQSRDAPHAPRAVESYLRGRTQA